MRVLPGRRPARRCRPAVVALASARQGVGRARPCSPRATSRCSSRSSSWPSTACPAASPRPPGAATAARRRPVVGAGPAAPTGAGAGGRRRRRGGRRPHRGPAGRRHRCRRRRSPRCWPTSRSPPGWCSPSAHRRHPTDWPRPGGSCSSAGSHSCRSALLVEGSPPRAQRGEHRRLRLPQPGRHRCSLRRVVRRHQPAPGRRTAAARSRCAGHRRGPRVDRARPVVVDGPTGRVRRDARVPSPTGRSSARSASPTRRSRAAGCAAVRVRSGAASGPPGARP